MQNKNSALIFLIKFFGTYIILFVIYALYLNKFQERTPTFVCAPITKTVALKSKRIIEMFGYNTNIKQNNNELSIELILNNKPIARVIEGCNSISLIILFISFIIAFKGSWQNTVLFSFVGSLIIYYFNIIRIAFITIGIYEYPSYQKTLHEVIFPALIYGMIFLFWFLWVKYFAIRK